MAEHKMLNEIKEQPEVLQRLVQNRGKNNIQQAADLILEANKEGGDIYLVGNGTSYHACMYGLYLFSYNNKFNFRIYDSGEFGDFVDNLKDNDLVILVSQSGETGDAVKIVTKIKNLSRAESRDKKLKIITVTNHPKEILGVESDLVIDMMAGKVVAIPSTKCYAASCAIFALISEQIAGKNNFSAQIGSIATEIEKFISLQYGEVRFLSDRISSSENLFTLGHSFGLANAYEAALKIKECSHIEAEGYSGMEFRHGPSSVVQPGTPVIVFSADYESEEDLQTIISEVKQKGALVIGISPENHHTFDHHFAVHERNQYSVFTSIIPVQLLAYELALAHGLNPDAPGGIKMVVK